jgi:hypothetical protein
MAEEKKSPIKIKFDSKIILIVLGVLAIVAVIIYLPREKEKPEQGYYTGPKYNFRNGQFVDEQGRVVPPPPGVRVPDKIEYKNTAKETD